jgi:hypothetical protein
MTRIWGAFAVLSLLAAAGCTSSEGTSVGERIILAGPSLPPEMAEEEADVNCPTVEVSDGGAVIQNSSGEGSPRSVITLGQLARECRGQRDGSTVVRVGIEGRAVLSGTGPSRFDVPVQVIVKSRGTVLASRVLRGSIAVPAGDSHGSFAIVAEGLVVPPSAAANFQIEVGLGGAGAAGSRRRG